MTSHELSVHEPSTTLGVQYKVASTLEERAAALQLVYESYLCAGLAEPNPHGMRVTPYHLLETTEVFIATYGGEVIFTMSLVIDGELGLPMEVAYRHEIQARRERGLLLGEVSCLADRRKVFRGFLPVFVRLSRLMAQYAWHRGLDELVIAVHPRHAPFYQRFMAFEPFGERKNYPTVRNRPATAFALNFDQIDRERPRSFDTFFGQWLPDGQVTPQPLSQSDRDFFCPMVDASFTVVPLEIPGALSESIPASMPLT